jgi:predicted amidophosphoribosyltransferase
MFETADFYRFPWNDFPDCIIHADEKQVRAHGSYHDAKTGDSDAAFKLVRTFLNEHCLAQIKQLEKTKQNSITLVSAHALEREGVNAIPEAMAELLGERFGWGVEHQVVQTNIVSHTKADGFSRLAKQAAFEGDVEPGQNYLLVDDFIGQGGTLANLRGWILHCGGRVVGSTVLTGKPYSAKL